MNLVQVRRCGNVNCLSQPSSSSESTTTFIRPVYQVDATVVCQLTKQIENKHLCKSFGQILYLASIQQFEFDRRICPKNCGTQERNVFLLTNVPDLISVAVDWNPSQCTTSDVEDFISIIDPFICLRELFYDVTTLDARNNQLNLIGLICFYGGTIEVFFSYEHITSQWLFCFDGNVLMIADWNGVLSKCIDFHLQPFLLIYANPDRHPVDISQLLRRTVIQAKNTVVSRERRLEQLSSFNPIQQQHSMTTTSTTKFQLENLSGNILNASSFGSLHSGMLFMPKSTPTVKTNSSSYISQATVVKVMQQQMLKKETSASDTTSISSSSLTSSPLITGRYRHENGSSSEDSLSSSQRDSGLSSNGINDASSDDSPRDSLVESEQTITDCLIKQTEQMMNHDRLDLICTTIEYHFEQSFKYESASDYTAALDSCQQALVFVDQILHMNNNNGVTMYARTKKNSLILRIRSLRKRHIEQQENSIRILPPVPPRSDSITTTSTFKPVPELLTKSRSSILSSNSPRSNRPKKNVKFSDNVALIVTTCDDVDEPPSEHLIHSFLRQMQKQTNDSSTILTTSSDSDSDTPSSTNETPIGLSECALCHKRCSKNNEINAYCSNCQFYMQRFQPTT